MMTSEPQTSTNSEPHDPRPDEGFASNVPGSSPGLRSSSASRTWSGWSRTWPGPFAEPGTGFEDAPNVKAFFDNAAEGVEELSADIGRRTVSELYDELDAAARRRPGVDPCRGGCCRLRVVPTVDVVRCQGPIPRSRSVVPVDVLPVPRHRRPFMIKPRPRTVQSHLGDAIRETRELVLVEDRPLSGRDDQ